METIRTQVALNLKAGTASDQKDINSDATLQQIVLNPQSAIRKLLPAFERDLPQLDRFLNKKKLAY